MTILSRLFLFLLMLPSLAAYAQSPAASKKGKFLKSLRILHYNIYGKDEKDCLERFRTIGRKINEASPKYDIVSFNEHYDPMVELWMSCDGDVMSKALQREGLYRDSNGQVRNHKFYPKGRTFQANGGNSLFTLYNITKFDWWKFKNTRRAIANGFTFNRIEVTKDLSIDFWTIHMESNGSDGCSDECRFKQFKQMADMQEKLRVGNPVIVAGDFNVGGPKSLRERERHLQNPWAFPYDGNGGYERIMNFYENPIDVWLLKNPRGMESAASTYDCLNNTTIKSNCRYQERIDYIMLPTSQTYQTVRYELEVKSIRKLRWLTPDGTDVSDHYGLEATIDIYDKYQ